MRDPTHCLPSAYQHFSQALENVESDDGLARIATAIAMHHQPGTSEEEILLELDRIASTITDRVHDDNPRALLAHLHQHLFDELGFRGNKLEYYDPRNSFLPWVIRSRRGIPGNDRQGLRPVQSGGDGRAALIRPFRYPFGVAGPLNRAKIAHHAGGGPPVTTTPAHAHTWLDRIKLGSREQSSVPTL